MALRLDLQCASSAPDLPTKPQIRRWVKAALRDERPQAELTVRLVDEAESRALNRDYRGKDKPTNVLSFPFDAPPGISSSLLGDLVICAPVVVREAAEQGKAASNHWAHIVVHGVLHLLGYDHEVESDAEVMEALEARVLAGFGISNPYGG